MLYKEGTCFTGSILTLYVVVRIFLLCMCRCILAPYILGKERSVRGKTPLCQLFCLGEKENDEAEVQLCGISPVFAFQIICFHPAFML